MREVEGIQNQKYKTKENERSDDKSRRSFGASYLFHDLVDSLRASLRRFHLIPLLNMFHHVSQRYSRIRDPAKGVNLPQKNTEAPHVRLAREFVEA